MSNLSRSEKKALNKLFDSLNEKEGVSWKIINIKKLIISIFLDNGMIRKNISKVGYK